jgi:glycosyltransferase involved in cell wall biosynthesis
LIKYSIVTVVKNGEKCIQSTIESVILQKNKDFEYIIICGESTDRTVDILNSYNKKVDKVIHEKDDGLYYAMNKALNYCNAEYINFLNCGDSYTSDNILNNITNELNNDTDIFCGSVYSFDDKNNKFFKSYRSRLQPLDHMFCFHQATFAKIDVFKKHTFDTQFKVVADYDWALKCYYSGYKFKFSETPIVNFEEGGFSYKNRILARIEEMYIQSKFLDEIEKIYDKNSFSRFLSYKKNNNRFFSRLFNDILNQFNKLRLSEKTLVLYGFGQLGRTLHAMFPDEFSRIYDKDFKELSSKYNLMIYSPDEIFTEPNEVILISSLGHERDIEDFLSKKSIDSYFKFQI